MSSPLSLSVVNVHVGADGSIGVRAQVTAVDDEPYCTVYIAHSVASGYRVNNFAARGLRRLAVYDIQATHDIAESFEKLLNARALVVP